jgi:hypothetical protein
VYQYLAHAGASCRVIDVAHAIPQRLLAAARARGVPPAPAASPELAELTRLLHERWQRPLLVWSLAFAAQPLMNDVIMLPARGRHGSVGMLDLAEAAHGVDRHSPFARRVPFASDGAGSFYVLVPNAEGPAAHVEFWDSSAYEPVERYAVASSFFAFMEFTALLDHAGEDPPWPHDRERVLALDPALAHLSGVAMPWE